MTRKKHRYKKPETTPVKEQVEPKEQTKSVDSDKNVTRYKAVVRSPLGEWWQENKKRVRLFGTIGGGGLLIGWLIFELLNLVF